MFALLRENFSFRNLLLGRILVIFADSIMFFSLLKWVEIATNSSSAYTFFFIAFYLPVALFALPIGAWISNKTLQKVMTYSIFIQIIFLVLFLIFHSMINYHWIYFVLLIISIMQLFFVPANQSLLPHIVNQEQRPNANSLLQLGFTVVRILGQVFTAFMIKLSISPVSLLSVSALLLILAIIFIYRIKPLIKIEHDEKHSQWKLMKDGITYIINNRSLKSLFTILTIAMIFAGAIDLILVSFLSDVLNVGVENLSFIGTSSLIGIAIGASIVPKFYRKIERKWLMIPPLYFLAISIGALYIINHWILILPFFFIQGIALGAFNVTFITYLQDVVDSQNYTRTFSLFHMLSSSSALPGILLTGFLIKQIGVLYTILIISSIMLSIGIFGSFFTPKLGKGEIKQEPEAKSATNA